MSGPFVRDVEQRSPAVTALAVVNFVLAAVRIGLSILFLAVAGPALLVGGLVTVEGPPKSDWIGLGELIYLLGLGLLGLGAVLLVLAVVFLLIGAVMILAGVGLLGRRRWSRPLTLVLGALGGLLGLLYLAGLLGLFLQDAAAVTGTDVAIGLTGALVHGGYCTMAYTVLLNKKVAAEFA